MIKLGLKKKRRNLPLDAWLFGSCRDLRRSDANGFVQRALDAANVYNNIVKYVSDANITGLTTLDSANRAEDVSDTESHLIKDTCSRQIGRAHV